MKKIYFLLLLAVTVMACNRPAATPDADCDCNLKIEHAKAQQMIEVQKQITDLRLDTALKAAEIACLKSKLKATEIQDCKEVKPAPPAPKPVKAKATSKKATPVAVKSVPVATPTPTPAPVQAPVAVKAAPVQAPVVTKSANSDIDMPVFKKMAGDDGIIIAWFRANQREDMYFPHYALLNGIKIKAAVTNYNGTGFNLQLKGTAGRTNPDGEFNYLENEFYYPANQVDALIKKVECFEVGYEGNTSMTKMERDGDWYILKVI